MNREQGLSLIETLTALLIVAVLATASISDFSKLVGRSRTHITALELTHVLALARSEAARRNVRITLRNNTGHWEDGWTLFVDTNNNALLDGDETVLQVTPPTNRSLTIRGNNPVRTYVSYIPTGETAHPNNAWQAGTLTICSHTPLSEGYQLTVSRGGRVRLEEVAGELTCQS